MTDANKTGESEAMTLEVAKAILAECGVDHRFCSSGTCLAASYFIEGHAAGSLQMRDMALKVVISRGDENAPYYESRGLIADAIRALPLEKP
jgi:hypothetical protein